MQHNRPSTITELSSADLAEVSGGMYPDFNLMNGYAEAGKMVAAQAASGDLYNPAKWQRNWGLAMMQFGWGTAGGVTH